MTTQDKLYHSSKHQLDMNSSIWGTTHAKHYIFKIKFCWLICESRFVTYHTRMFNFTNTTLQVSIVLQWTKMNIAQWFTGQTQNKLEVGTRNLKLFCEPLRGGTFTKDLTSISLCRTWASQYSLEMLLFSPLSFMPCYDYEHSITDFYNSAIWEI